VKKFFSLIFVTIFFTFVWKNTHHETPPEWQLENIDGTLVSVYEMVDDLDDADDQYAVLEIDKNGITRSIISLDKTLLSILKVNMEVHAKIYQRKNVSELWELRIDEQLYISFEDTKEIKWELTKNKTYMLVCFYIVFIGSILFGDGLRGREY